MFDPERLLGKMIGGAAGGGSSIVEGLAGELAGGKGLLTLVGLGVGAYEVLKEQKKTSAPPPCPPPVKSGPFAGAGSTPPPPPPPPGHSSADTALADQKGEKEDIPEKISSRDMAVRMIQVMIAAAHADGSMDSEEEEVILERLGTAELSREERLYLIGEMKRPRSIQELGSGITDSSIAAALYTLACKTITLDTPEERKWLDELAEALGLSKNVQVFLEGECR